MTRVEGVIYCSQACAKKGAADAKGLKKRLTTEREGSVGGLLLKLAIAALVLVAVMEWLGVVNFVSFF